MLIETQKISQTEIQCCHDKRLDLNRWTFPLDFSILGSHFLGHQGNPCHSLPASMACAWRWSSQGKLFSVSEVMGVPPIFFSSKLWITLDDYWNPWWLEDPAFFRTLYLPWSLEKINRTPGIYPVVSYISALGGWSFYNKHVPNNRRLWSGDCFTLW